jgi:hypothetical protein
VGASSVSHKKETLARVVKLLEKDYPKTRIQLRFGYPVFRRRKRSILVGAMAIYQQPPLSVTQSRWHFFAGA